MARRRQSLTREVKLPEDLKRAKIEDSEETLQEMLLRKSSESTKQDSFFQENLQEVIQPVDSVTTAHVIDQSENTKEATTTKASTVCMNITTPLHQPTPHKRSSSNVSTLSNKSKQDSPNVSRTRTPPNGLQTFSSVSSPTPPRIRRHLKPLSESEQHQQTKALIEKLRPKYTHNNYPERRPKPIITNIRPSTMTSSTVKPRKPDQSLIHRLPQLYKPTKITLQRDINFIHSLQKLHSLKLPNFVESGKNIKGEKKIDHNTLLTAMNSVSKYHIFNRVDVDIKTVAMLRDSERWKESQFDLDVKRVLLMKEKDTGKVEEEWKKVLGVTPMKTFRDFK